MHCACRGHGLWVEAGARLQAPGLPSPLWRCRPASEPRSPSLTSTAGESMEKPLQSGPWGSGHSLSDHSFQKESSHYFGYVYFRQVKDSSVKRGYFQKVSNLGWHC